MYSGFERKISQGAEPNVDQSESWMIDADVTAAFCAIPAVADFAALESPEELRSFGKDYVLLLPQRERAHRRGGIMPAVLAMAVTHLQRIAAHLDLHRSAVTSTCMRFGHASIFTPRFSPPLGKLTHQNHAALI
jgi:hypothetical protein